MGLYRNKYYRRCNGDDHWWIRFKDLDGRDRRERAFKSKRESERLLAQRVAAVTEGRQAPSKRDGSKLFSEFADDYMEAHGSRLAWARSVQFILRHWEKHLGPKCKLKDITVRKVEAFRSKRLEAGIKPSTVNRNLAVLRRALNVAVDWDLLRENPARRLKPYRENNQRLRFLTQGEVARLLAECRCSRNELLEPLAALALNTGARKEELLGLRWADVSFEARTIAFPTTKNSERRDIPLNKAAFAVLSRLHRSTGNDTHAFSRNGKRVEDVRGAWESAVRRAGIEDFVFHDTRHCYASAAVQAGMDLYRLQRILGHKTQLMVQRYAHLRPRDLREAVELVSFESPED